MTWLNLNIYCEDLRLKKVGFLMQDVQNQLSFAEGENQVLGGGKMSKTQMKVYREGDFSVRCDFSIRNII